MEFKELKLNRRRRSRDRLTHAADSLGPGRTDSISGEQIAVCRRVPAAINICLPAPLEKQQNRRRFKASRVPTVRPQILSHCHTENPHVDFHSKSIALSSCVPTKHAFVFPHWSGEPLPDGSAVTLTLRQHARLQRLRLQTMTELQPNQAAAPLPEKPAARSAAMRLLFSETIWRKSGIQWKHRQGLYS